jgi:hypothetical protein
LINLHLNYFFHKFSGLGIIDNKISGGFRGRALVLLFEKNFSIFSCKNEEKMNLYYRRWALKSGFCRSPPLPSKKRCSSPSKILDPRLNKTQAPDGIHGIYHTQTSIVDADLNNVQLRSVTIGKITIYPLMAKKTEHFYNKVMSWFFFNNLHCEIVFEAIFEEYFFIVCFEIMKKISHDHSIHKYFRIH